jgi:hypothetical protein
MRDDEVIDLRQFRNEMAKEHGKDSVSSEIMDKFVTYRLRKHGKSGPDTLYDFKMQFGEMKLNMAAFGK